MHPELFTIPVIGLVIKSYGFMLMLGFLSAIWIGMRIAERVRSNPDVILNCGILALFGGIVGARLFYVFHYWKSNFAYQKNPLLAALNITSGGMEYLGGVFGAVVVVVLYITLRGRLFGNRSDRLSLRLYLDLLAPLAMWGLAFGRMGCFLNGCCWGGLCVNDHQQAALPWAVQFPFGSWPQTRQWSNRQMTVPAELICDDPRITEVTTLVPQALLKLPPEALQRVHEFEELNTQYQTAKRRGESGEAFQKLRQQWEHMRKVVLRRDARLQPLLLAQQYPSRKDPSHQMTVGELRDLAQHYRSLPVHPAQGYGIINAFLLFALLYMIFNRRKRHGVVFGWMLLLYPITRFILELIRVDNPHEFDGLTISQATGIAVFLVGVLWMVAIYKWLPQRSPYAVPWADPGPPGPASEKPSPATD